MIKREVAPQQANIFGEDDFWEDDEAATGPPPDEYRIWCDDSIHNEGNASADDDITTASNETQASGEMAYYIFQYFSTDSDQESDEI
jgi:hypothetical protein